MAPGMSKLRCITTRCSLEIGAFSRVGQTLHPKPTAPRFITQRDGLLVAGDASGRLAIWNAGIDSASGGGHRH